MLYFQCIRRRTTQGSGIMKRGTKLAAAGTAAGIALVIALGVYAGRNLHLFSISEAPSGNQALPAAADQAVPRSAGNIAAPRPERGTDAAITERSTDASPEEGPDPQTAAALHAAKLAALGLPEHRIIFVGDSRVVGMGEAEEDNYDSCVYIGEVGEGCPWFLEDGIPQMEKAIEAWPEAPVVINLGVNDLWDIGLYLDTYREITAAHPDTRFFFLSVNPVDSDELTVDNMGIRAFNDKLREAFPDDYLDSSTYLRIREFETVDGLHYTKESYCCIHDFVVRQLFKEESTG